MLILSRNLGEKVMVLDEKGEILAEITYVELRGSQIKLGIQADPKYKVHREEIYLKVKAGG